MKVIVIGNNHAGTAAITHLRKFHPEAEVVSYDRNDNISFLACGIALWVGGTIRDPKGLFYATPEGLRELGVKVNMGCDVTSIDFDAKTVRGKVLASGAEFVDHYDKLILATGSWPITPPVEGVELDGIMFSKLYQHAQTIIDRLKNPEARKVVVVGAGYIGVELVEAFRHHGRDVTLIEATDRVLSAYFDPEFTEEPEARLREKGVQVRTSEKVLKFLGDSRGRVRRVVTDKGEYEADLVILCVGFRPNADLYRGKLETLPNGALLTDEYMRTSDPDVLACGDCVAVRSNVCDGPAYIALATNAVRTGILCAANVKDSKIPFPGVQGSNAIKVYDCNLASTGFSETTAKARGLNVKSSFLEDVSRPEFMPSQDRVKVKVVYDAATRRLLGAQISSKGDYTLAIHTFSLAIQKHMTVDEFALVDFFFLPHFNKPVSWLTAVALEAK
jgi:NADPH-dependent 2,4-dienoyl-CoA reductase/sulfur reductase-like enzyme